MVPGQEGVEGTGMNETIQKGISCKAKRDARRCQPGESRGGRVVKGGGSFPTPSPGPTGLSLGSTPCLSLLLGESVKSSALPGTQEASGLASITVETPPPQSPSI